MADQCNADLLLELARWEFDREQLIAEAAPQEAIDEVDARRVHVFVSFTGDASALEEANLTVGHYDDSVATGSILLRHLAALQAVPGVERINLGARLNLHIDRSMPEVKVNAVRSKAPPYVATVGPRPYTGKGVLIGVIDDSIYERHPSFIKPSPNPQTKLTRFVGIWDMASTPDPAKAQKSPPGFKYGVFWDEAAINRTLAAGVRGFSMIPLASLYDHGSHVTGIAAGNGAIKEPNFAPYTFVGVAPEADIAFTNAAQYDWSGVGIGDSVKFIFALAAERGQPCVINMSFGTHEGARDGSADVERAIDRALLDSNGQPVPGRAVVASAGNEGAAHRHSRKLISPGGKLVFRLNEVDIPFPKKKHSLPRPEGDRMFGFDRIYIWYSGSAAIDIRVTPPGGPPDPPAFVKPGDVKISKSVGVVSGGPDPANGKNYIVLTLFAPVKYGIWTLELQETAGVEAPVDMWVDRNGDIYTYPQFVDGDDVVANTLTCPATAKTAIAVGGYISEPALLQQEKYGSLYEHSSRGLDSTFGVSNAEVRPHLVAPARRIISCNNSSFADEEGGLIAILQRFGGLDLKWHALMTGTSQAAPHVTGVVALMFERNPNLTWQQIRAILTSTARKDQIPDLVLPNRHWGFGKLDASAALAAVPLP